MGFAGVRIIVGLGWETVSKALGRAITKFNLIRGTVFLPLVSKIPHRFVGL